MKWILLGSTLIFSSSLLASASPSISPRIVGGNDVSQVQPWMVSLQVPWQQGYAHICGASLIAPQWVLSAAHCVEDMTSHQLFVRLGITDLNQSGELFSVDKIFSHQNYQSATLTNDIALIHLAKPSSATPLDLLAPIDFAQLPWQTSLQVLGWGATNKAGNEYGEQLQQVSVPYVDCPFNNLPSGVICAGGEEGQDACFGDSGGPLILREQGRDVQVGLVSAGYGSNCAEAGMPGGYTSVSYFSDWISQTMQQVWLGDVDLGNIRVDEGYEFSLPLHNQTDQVVTLSSVQTTSTFIQVQPDMLGTQILPNTSLNVAFEYTPTTTAGTLPASLSYEVTANFVEDIDNNGQSESASADLMLTLVAPTPVPTPMPSPNPSQAPTTEPVITSSSGGGSLSWFALLLFGLCAGYRARS
ncbi:serine protease [Motilimonas eburnea]|uniref:serine protease n=1 Tax=Motilimonas eburnea TaxID=1737488 RepID=UPI001E57763A|nr:serine protease [Motilimonas eburnea]MCE2573621.1 serine protease [Motilimonas eburnea]